MICGGFCAWFEDFFLIAPRPQQAISSHLQWEVMWGAIELRKFVHLDDPWIMACTYLRPCKGRVAGCKHASTTRITVTATASPSESSLPLVWSMPLLSQHWFWVSSVTLRVTLRMNQSLFRVNTESESSLDHRYVLCSTHGPLPWPWYVRAVPPTSRPTNTLLLIIPAQLPATRPSEASPLLYCSTV